MNYLICISTFVDFHRVRSAFADRQTYSGFVIESIVQANALVAYAALALSVCGLNGEGRASARLMDVAWSERRTHEQLRRMKVHAVLVEVVSFQHGRH